MPAPLWGGRVVIRGESRSGKIDALTGLRFWAAALIVTEHAAMLRMPIPSWDFGGGVSLFFVLSGFILAYVYPQLDDWRAVQRFLVLRVARIWPAHLVMLVVWLAVIGGTVFSAPFVANLMMVQAWVPYYPWYFSFNAPSWSISTEFFFYLVFPLLIIGWQRNWWWKWLAAAAILAGLIAVCTLARLPNLSTEDVVTVHGLIYINPLSRVFEFVTGMVAYSCFAALKPDARRFGLMTGSLLELTVLATAIYSIVELPLFRLAKWPGLVGWNQWLVQAGSLLPTFSVLIVVLALQTGLVSRFLGSRLLVLLGELSYSIYLTHMGVFAVYTRYWMPAGSKPDYEGLAICLAVTLAMSFAIWRLIETPVRRAARRAVDGRRLGKRWSSPALIAERGVTPL